MSIAQTLLSRMEEAGKHKIDPKKYYYGYVERGRLDLHAGPFNSREEADKRSLEDAEFTAQEQGGDSEEYDYEIFLGSDLIKKFKECVEAPGAKAF